MGKRYAHGVLGPANGVLWRRDIPVPGQFYRSHMANSQKETKIIPGYSSFGLIRTFSGLETSFLNQWELGKHVRWSL